MKPTMAFPQNTFTRQGLFFVILREEEPTSDSVTTIAPAGFCHFERLQIPTEEMNSGTEAELENIFPFKLGDPLPCGVLPVVPIDESELEAQSVVAIFWPNDVIASVDVILQQLAALGYKLQIEERLFLEWFAAPEEDLSDYEVPSLIPQKTTILQ